MGCSSNSDTTSANGSQFTLDSEKLRPRGRLQFFFHSPESEFPIRDVTNEQGAGQKLEPHLEESAENYCAECYQKNNIIPFLKSDEQYLFLFTTCRNPDLAMSGKRFIVGYLEKKRALDREGHFAVQGPISLYSFDEAYPLGELHDSPMQIRQLKLDESETDAVLTHFENKTDMFDQCLSEVERLEDSIDRQETSSPDCGCTSFDTGC